MQILGMLEQRTASPSELSDELGVPLGNVSYHVRQLQSFGLIRLVRTTPRRGSIEHHYELIARPDITDHEWETLPEIVRQAMIGATLAPISRLVNNAAVAGGFSRRDAHISRTALTLDGEGWRDAAAALMETCHRLEEIEQESLERLAAGAGDASQSTLVIMHFDSTTVSDEHTDHAEHHTGARAERV